MSPSATGPHRRQPRGGLNAPSRCAREALPVKGILARFRAIGGVLTGFAFAGVLGASLTCLAANSAPPTGPTTPPVIPPPMPARTIQPSKDPLPGESVVLNDRGTNFTLFLPGGWRVPASGEATLCVHFHSAVWFGIQEHLRRGLAGPLICFHAGEGSSVYRIPFEDRERFGRWLRLVEAELRRRGAPADTRVTAVDISSFSAGYGAVREIVKSPEYRRLIRRIVLADSMYASYDAAALKTGVKRPDPDHIAPWVPFAEAAARGEKTFVLTHSEVPTSTYANSAACAAALIAAVGAPRVPVAPGSIPAADDPEFPLRYLSDLGGFHVWGYAGTNAMAHMTHARHLADVWMALDAAERKSEDRKPKAEGSPKAEVRDPNRR